MSTRTATSSQSKNNVSFNRKPGGYLNYDSEESLYDLRDVSRAIAEKGVGSLMQTDPTSLAIPERTAYHPHFWITRNLINTSIILGFYKPYQTTNQANNLITEDTFYTINEKDEGP